MTTTIPDLPRLVWRDDGALDKLTLTIACTGTTAELEVHLQMQRRRYPLRVVRWERGATWQAGTLAVEVTVGDHRPNPQAGHPGEYSQPVQGSSAERVEEEED